jgi:serine/threonine protein kinase/Leucine-rich repeat (LRR) protein
MASVSSSSLVDALRQYRLLEPVQLEELKNFQGRFPDPKALARELMQRGWLTPYQANQLLQGKGQELVLGSYVLLERVGEGGMGEVFKARNWKLARVVALKVIRKERLSNPDAIRRFQREVRSAAALDHPNIVHAFDADEIGGTHLLVMEYIEGATDLSRLVKKNGPLPVSQACEYIRQAALGLQHACERGLVHRDIKPHNLLLTADGKTVKILDMGLARLDQPSEDDQSSTMTQEGAVMGTPDYIAPEQALESHTVDIRADLYSLGCTFYYLLTGRVPFGGGTLLQKLNKHQNQEARPVETLRPDVSPGIARVVRKLMAKKPGDRYQTPAEVAVALKAVFSTGSGDSLAASGTLAEGAGLVAASRGDTLNSAFAFKATSDTEALVNAPHHLGRKAGKRRWLLFSVAGGAFLLVVIIFLAIKQSGGKKPPVKDEDHPVVAAPSKKTSAKGDDAWVKQVAAMPAEMQVEAVAARLKELNPDFDGKVTHTIENGVVTDLTFLTDDVTDISPVRALKGLNGLYCNGSNGGKGRLSDLSPLKDMKLKALSCVFTQVANLSPLEDMKLTGLHCGGTQVSDLSPLRDMKLTVLGCWSTPVSDLSPLKGMPLTSLQCQGTPVSDLSPLKDMKLTGLNCTSTKVADLSPLKDMKLTVLSVYGTPVSDLSPLKGMKLTDLQCGSTKVSDLSPLKGMPLTSLACAGTKVIDLSPLKNMPLQLLYCDFKPYRDTDILRSIKTLAQINGKPATEFWKEVDAQRAAFEAWCKEVAAMPAEKQVEAVAAKLKELNPGFDGKVTHTIEAGVVTSLGFLTDNVADISPVGALKRLKALSCGGSGAGTGNLSDLSPLKGMKLTNLYCGGTKVSDLSPLKGMVLTALYCHRTQVSDLSPLKGMPLTTLVCFETHVHDLSPLKGMALSILACGDTQVADLSPLKDMKLTGLYCSGTKVADLSLLKDMPLKELNCDFMPDRDAKILRSIKTLEKINNKPAAEFWKEVDAQRAAFEAWCKQVAAMPADKQVDAVAAKLKELNPGFDGKVTPTIADDMVRELQFVSDHVTDISPVSALKGLKRLACTGGSAGSGSLSDLSPLKGMKLTNLDCGSTKVSDLSPLKGMKLTGLAFYGTPVSDLSPLKGMKLMRLHCAGAPVSDLSPLKGMPLTELECAGTKVSDLSPLKGMRLTYLGCAGTKVTDLLPLKGIPLKALHCDFMHERDAEILRSIKTLERINDKEAKEFWKEVKAKEKEKKS